MARVKYKALYQQEQQAREAMGARLEALRRRVSGLAHEGRNVAHRLQQERERVLYRLPYHEWLAFAVYADTIARYSPAGDYVSFLEQPGNGNILFTGKPVVPEEPV